MSTDPPSKLVDGQITVGAVHNKLAEGIWFDPICFRSSLSSQTQKVEMDALMNVHGGMRHFGQDFNLNTAIHNAHIEQQKWSEANKQIINKTELIT